MHIIITFDKFKDILLQSMIHRNVMVLFKRFELTALPKIIDRL